MKGSSSSQSEKLKAYYAAMTPERRAEWRKNISVATKAGMHRWHARRTEESREHSRALQSDAAICRIWIKRTPKYKFPEGHAPMSNHDRAALTRVEKASVKRILKDLATTRPDLFKDAIIDGLLAPAPRSFPYIALAAAYLDGKPVDAEPVPSAIVDLSSLTPEELLQRALSIAHTLRERRETRGAALAVIDAEVIPQPEDK